MARPNTRRDEFHELLEQISYANLEIAIVEYLAVADRKAWMKELKSASSRRYFLIWQGEPLDAKAIGKAALRANDYRFEYWHTDPIIDVLEHIGFAIWDVDRDGAFDRNAAAAYETVRRLARVGQQRFRSDALILWGNRCAVSGVALDTALEAAHTVPHTQDGEMNVRNSIVLRTDIHRLFDAGLIAIDPVNLCVVSQSQVEVFYPELTGKSIMLPQGGPSAKAFETRWANFKVC